jgi:hypothetical protein
MATDTRGALMGGTGKMEKTMSQLKCQWKIIMNNTNDNAVSSVKNL